MFANTYQNGFHTQVWDSRVNPQKNPLYKQLFKKVPSSIKNSYDKQVKSFIFQLQGNQRLSFPADDRQQLSLHQRYLILQLQIPIGANWSLQLAFNDVNNNKKRINITTMPGKQQLKYFSFRYPLDPGAIEKGIWMFLAIDIYSFCNAFKNTVFRSLDNIVICSSCKIRRLFTMKEWTEFQIPKNYWLPSNLPQTMQIIEFKQAKQSTLASNIAMMNSVGIYSKLTESKVVENHPSALRHSQKSSPIQQKINLKGTIKFPGVNNRSKELTPLKSSKLSQKIQLANRNQVVKEFGVIGKSNRSLTKADIIIEKSKLRINSLQEKQEQIKNRLKSEDHRFTEKVSLKQTAKYLRGENLFKSDLFKSQFSQSGLGESNIRKLKNQSPKLLKMKKNFEQDNIFKEESYSSSSYSRLTNKESAKTLRDLKKRDESDLIKQNVRLSDLKENEIEIQEQSSRSGIDKRSFIRNTRDSKISLVKEREEIIEEDVWTEEQEDNRKPQSPIEEMIQSQQGFNVGSHGIGHVGQTVITKQNNKEVISREQLTQLKPPNQLELIYDEMIGCYYHPQTNTYYEIKK